MDRSRKPPALRIDFVSDVVCPWCVIGLKNLQEALRRTAGELEADLHIQPFELNPDMPPGGENLAQRLERKFGRSPAEMEAAQAQMRERAAAAGFEMAPRPQGRIYNTFAAHRLLHWAELHGRQLALKEALFTAYFTRDQAIDDPDVLAHAAGEAGLSEEEARDVVGSGRYADEVRAEEARWRMLGINSVPSIVLESAHLVSGAQPPEVFERVLRELATQAG
jgi:predicted DsbA family dithiol-disulfide isomerase